MNHSRQLRRALITHPQYVGMIELTIQPEAVETDTAILFIGPLAPPDEQLAHASWPGWFSPDDERDGGHSER